MIGHSCNVEAEFLDLEHLCSVLRPRPTRQCENLEPQFVVHADNANKKRTSLDQCRWDPRKEKI